MEPHGNGPNRAPPDVDLAKVWIGVATAVWSRPVGPIERLARCLLRSPGLARALVTTPTLVLSWLIASGMVLAAGVVLTHTTGAPWVALLAPALAGAGIAYAYGPGIDPAFELSQSLAISDRLVLLVRALAVFGLNTLLGGLASLGAAGLTGLTFGWLLPMTMVSALALAAATVARNANVGVAAALAVWALIVLGSATAGGDPAVLLAVRFAPGYLLLALAGVGVALYATDGRRGKGMGWQ